MRDSETTAALPLMSEDNILGQMVRYFATRTNENYFVFSLPSNDMLIMTHIKDDGLLHVRPWDCKLMREGVIIFECYSLYFVDCFYMVRQFLVNERGDA